MMEIVVCPGFPELSIHWGPHVAIWKKAGISTRIIPTLELARETASSHFQQTFEAMGKKFAALIDESNEDVHIVCGDLGALVVLGSIRFLNRPESVKKITFYNSAVHKVNLNRCFHIPLLSLPFAAEFFLGLNTALNIASDFPYDACAQIGKNASLYTRATRKIYQTLFIGQVRSRIKSKPLKPFRWKVSRPAISVVWGQDDRFFGKDQLEDLKNFLIPDSIEIWGSGHFAHLKDPIGFCDRVLSKTDKINK